MNEQPPFALGQEVFVAWAHIYAERREPCPLCFGKLAVTLILGNGEQVSVECEACGAGFEGPRGYVMERGPESGVRSGRVTGLSQDWNRWRVEVERSSEDVENIFTTREAAEARRAVLAAAADTDAARRRWENQQQQRKSLTWKASYHRRCIKQAEHDLEYHRARLKELPAARQRAGSAE